MIHGCSDLKGANDPYVYTPSTSYSTWQPKKDQERVNTQDKDYSYLKQEIPLTLGEIINIALVNNPDTTESWAVAREQAGVYGQSLQDDFILADIDGNYQRSRTAEFTSSDRTIVYETTYGAELCLSYTLLDFGQTRYSSKAALQALYSADWSHNSQIQLVVQETMTDFYNYLFQKQELTSANQDLKNAQVSFDAVMEKFRNGLADIGDRVQAKTKLLQQKLNIVTQKQTLNNAYTELVKQMGVPANEDIIIQDYPQIIKTYDVDNLDNLILEAMKNRPDLIAQEADVISKEKNLIANKRKNYLTIVGGFNIGRQYYQHGLNDEYDFKAQVSLNYPLFQGFFIKNQVKQARGELEVARAKLDQVKLSILQDVTNYRVDVELSKEALTFAEEFLASAEEDFKLNLMKYKVGTATIVELINAQTSVADARSKLAESKKNWYTSLANLAYATGALKPNEVLHE